MPEINLDDILKAEKKAQAVTKPIAGANGDNVLQDINNFVKNADGILKTFKGVLDSAINFRNNPQAQKRLVSQNPKLKQKLDMKKKGVSVTDEAETTYNTIMQTIGRFKKDYGNMTLTEVYDFLENNKAIVIEGIKADLNAKEKINKAG